MRALALIGAISAFFAASTAFAQVDYEALKHVDLRDLGNNNTYLQGTSNHIQGFMKNNPARFVGPMTTQGIPDANAHTAVRYYESGARGPKGNIRADQNDGGRNKFFADEDQSDRLPTRINTIFSAEYEEVIEEVVNSKFVLKMILFIHDPVNPAGISSNGYFFRRLTVQIDWSKSSDPNEFFKVLSLDQDIPLSAVQFSLWGDLLDRKVILEDAVFGITKVFPLGVGSFKIRTGQNMDGTVEIMTDRFDAGARLYKVKAMEGHGGSSNTRARNYPGYYRGRPFFGIIANDGKYKSIGLHYQIDADGLKRGFVSHGCIRVRDKDLYQLDAILNEGAQEYLPVRVHYHLGDRFVARTHPMPHLDNMYGAAVYSSVPTENKIQCKFTSYNVQYDRRNPGVHTLADGDCLTMTKMVGRPTSDVINYLMGYTIDRPMGLYSSGRDHVPYELARGIEDAADELESDGGQEEKQRQRRDLGTFFQDFFGGRLFEPRERVQRRDRTIRLLEPGRDTPYMALEQPPAIPPLVVANPLGSGVNRNRPQVNSTVTVTELPPISNEPVVTQPVEQPVVNQPVVETEGQRKKREDLAETVRSLESVSGWIQQYCTPAPISDTYVSYCNTWKNNDLPKWQRYYDYLMRQ